MKKSPVQTWVVALVCTVLVNIIAAHPSAAQGTGASIFTAADAAQKLQEAFQLGGGRPMPSMTFTGTGCCASACHHPRPGKHDCCSAPCKKQACCSKPPVATEQTSNPTPPGMLGVNGSSQAPSVPSRSSSSESSQSSSAPTSSWNPDQSHMAAPTQNQGNMFTNFISRTMPQAASTAPKQIASKVNSAARSTTNQAEQRIRDRVHEILNGRQK